MKQERANLDGFINCFGLLTDAKKTDETDQKFCKNFFGFL